MKNRVIVEIAGQTFTIVSDDDIDYVEKVAGIVDTQIEKVYSTPGVSKVQAMLLASCNLADEKIKAEQSLDNIRKQMKSYLDDAAVLRTEIAELKREIIRLKRGQE